ncbi:DUF2182 domain-containing protein [Hoeflea sp. G2-23]|uniref:DUF2182 domain-containing protein n=1 Tax=Hoeflea algicola TaxID=2983763 RepID=A0ABT3Z4H0_9HYPH|nr:DUF2182 domain-containing protein [Hoeflea algicola]MCY0146664.1 DUF2182 domain-containing protein [Hoeflea algicola]
MFTPSGNPDPLEGRFDHLDRSGQTIATLSRKPLWLVMAMAILTTAIAWWLLLSMAGAVAGFEGSARPLGPGMSLIARFLPVDSGSFAARIADLCLSADSGALLSGGGTIGIYLALVMMWTAMAAAMMLPTAAPMIRTYSEIADTAAARGDPVVHPLVLASGYLFVWSLAAILFASAQMTVTSFTGTTAAEPVKGVVAGLILFGAGAYQFTPLKEACLSKCRNPFTTLFARWRSSTLGVFRLGMEQGVWCLGCCWAMMLIMLAVGSMNVVWMAALTLFTFVEKTGTGRVTSRLGGAIVSFWGVALIWSAVN